MSIHVDVSEILRFAPNDNTFYICNKYASYYLIEARSMYLSMSIAWNEFAYFVLICL